MAKQIWELGDSGETATSKVAANFDELYARQTYIGQINVKSDSYGAKGDGITDDSAAIKAALEVALGGAIGTPVYFPEGNYLVQSDIILTGILKDVNLCSDGGVVINCGTNVFRFEAGTVLGTTNLTGNVSKYEVSIPVANPLTFAVGDIVHIKSSALWSGTTYPKGELQKIRKIDGNDIYFYEYLFDDYDMSNTTITQYKYPRFAAQNIRFVFDAPTTGLYLSYFKSVGIHNVEISGARLSGLTTYYCYDVLVNKYTSFKTYETSDDGGYAYGYTIASCQNVSVQNSFISGAKHGVMIGGDFPNRNIKILSSYFSEQINGHGNCELVDIVNCTCYGPLTFWGKSVRILNNLMYGLGVRPEFGRGSYAIAIATAHNTGSIIIIKENRIVNGNFMTFSSSGISGGFLEVSGNTADVNGDIIILKQELEAAGRVSKTIISDNTNVGFQITGTYFDDILIKNNYLNSSYFPVLIEGIPDALGNISILGNKITSPTELYPIRIGRYDTAPNTPEAKRCIIKNNTIEQIGARGKWCDIIVDEYLEVSGNTFLNMENPAKISNVVKKCYWDNNVSIGVTNGVVNQALQVFTNASPEI